MENTKTLEILKQAILLEKRGKAFYASSAMQSTDADVKKIFEIMAEEEDAHIRFLSEQYKAYNASKKFAITELPSDVLQEGTVEKILTEKIKKQISAASFEAAAIAAAIDMENRAIAVYAERAQSATDPEEKKFYEWLAEWERGHHKLLHELDNELKEKVWNDNNFWPF